MDYISSPSSATLNVPWQQWAWTGPLGMEIDPPHPWQYHE